MSDHLECQICLETMVVPVTCECGHSFCYECIYLWFQNKLLCPTCRAQINEKPKRTMQLHQITKLLFDVATDSMTDQEAIVKAKKIWRERNDVYEQASRDDSLYGDLFDQALTMIDVSDGVPRCGNCGWEVYGEHCEHCGVQLRHPVDEFDADEDSVGISSDDEQIRLNGRDSYDSDDGFVVSDEEVLDDAAGEAPSILGDLDFHGFLEHEAHTDNERPIQLSDDDDDDSDLEFIGDGHREYSSGEGQRNHHISRDSQSNMVDLDSLSDGELLQIHSDDGYDRFDDFSERQSHDSYDDDIQGNHHYDSHGHYDDDSPIISYELDSEHLLDDEDLQGALNNFNTNRRRRVILSDTESESE